MSQENVEVVRRHYEAVEQAFEAYWEDPPLGGGGLERWRASARGRSNDPLRPPECGVEDRATTGVTYRGYADIAKGWDQLLRGRWGVRSQPQRGQRPWGGPCACRNRSSFEGQVE